MSDAPAIKDPPTTSRAWHFNRRRAIGVLIVFLLLNLLWRAVRYSLNPPFWGDETMLAASLLARDYGGMLQPLMWAQLAPPGFLWLSEAVSRVLGFGEWSLRLLPALAGTLATGLFAWMAWRHLPRREAVLASCILAASYYPMRHSLEFKPYSTDLLLGVVIMFLAMELARRATPGRWLAFATAGAIGAWLSFPSVLAFGGAGAWLFARALYRNDKPQAMWSVGAGLVGLVSFGVLYVVIADWRAQHTADYRAMDMWANSFPPWDRPWRLPLWLIEIHTGRMLSYPNGGKNFGSVGTFLLCLLGGVRLYRSPRRPLLWLLLAPLAVGLLAAAVGKYPYGGSMRTMLYATPGIVILMAVGVWCGLVIVLARSKARVGYVLVLALLTLLPLLGVIQDVRRPHRLDADLDTRNVMRQLAAQATADDQWVYLRTRPSVSGVHGEHQLLSGQSASAIQFYGDWLSPSVKHFDTPPEALAESPANARIVLLDHGKADVTTPPSFVAQPYLNALRARRDKPVVTVHRLGDSATLVTYEFE